MKTNLATYRTQKVADSRIADSIFHMHSDFLTPQSPYLCKNYA